MFSTVRIWCLYILAFSLVAAVLPPRFVQGATLAGGEYFFDSDPGAGKGNTIAFPVDGAFDGNDEDIEIADLDISGLRYGRHTLSVRFRNSDGVWGIPRTAVFQVAAETTALFAAAEYFIDQDPGIGNGTPLPAVSDTGLASVTQLRLEDVNIAGLGHGEHTLFVRARDSHGRWSIVRKVRFKIYPPLTISAAEFFIDQDRGVGEGIAMAAVDAPFNSAKEAAQRSAIDTSFLAAGSHTAFVRFRDNFGRWNSTASASFSVFSNDSPATAQPIVPGWDAVDRLLAGQPDRYYKIQVSGPSNVTIAFSHRYLEESGIAWKVALVDQSLREVASFVATGPEPLTTRTFLVTPGTYYIAVSDASTAGGAAGEEYRLSVMMEGTEIAGRLQGGLALPAAFRPERIYAFAAYASNGGNADAGVPLLVISNDLNAEMSLSPHGPFTRESLALVAVDPSRGRAVIPPGGSVDIPVYLKSPQGGVDAAIRMNLQAVVADASPVDWEALGREGRPGDYDPEAWSIIIRNLQSRLGYTTAQYAGILVEDALYLAQHRRAESGKLSGGTVTTEAERNSSVYDVLGLLRFELGKASGTIHPKSVLADATDVVSRQPGLPLTFARVAPQPIPSRFRQGALGRGWSHSWEYRAVVDPSTGAVAMSGPGGALRSFERQRDGSYQGKGEQGTVSVADGAVTFLAKEGTVWKYNADGTLHSVAERNGNTLTASYAGGRLSAITHSNGGALRFGYDVEGRISEIEEPEGGKVLYRYADEQLVEVEQPGGVITRYSYNAAESGQAARALSAIEYPDGAHRYYGYDAQGRLVAESGDNGSGRVAYTFEDAGDVIVTRNGNPPQATLVRYGTWGEILKLQEATGAVTSAAYDSLGQLTRLTRPDGRSSSFAYDGKGNLVGASDPMGNVVQMGYDPETNQLRSLVDARGNRSELSYDSTGNLNRVSLPGLNPLLLEHDPSGMPSSVTNGRGEMVRLFSDAKGRPARKSYPDGRHVDYSYDSRGNLVAAVDSLTGAITFAYDNRGFLTKMEYADGRGFTFSYNNAGKRTRRASHDGVIVNYAYDAAGRLHTLSDGSGGNIVTYEYDAAGRLAKESKGNGTVTTYQYDAAGRLLKLVNLAPSRSVHSYFEYSYDVNGNVVTMKSLEGITSYRYDAGGRLTAVTLPSGKKITYAYDETGNRTTVSDNDVKKAYVVNEVNKYVRIGDTIFVYDKDGNLASRTDARGTSAYHYDAENRLVKVVTPDKGTWEYYYDALGNRDKVSHNGVWTSYLSEPNGNPAAEYHQDRGRTSYTSGMGALSSTDQSGNTRYFNVDRDMNAREVTDSSGNIVASYPPPSDGGAGGTVLPVGPDGTMNDGNGLIHRGDTLNIPDSGRGEDPFPSKVLKWSSELLKELRKDPSGRAFGQKLVELSVDELLDLSEEERNDSWGIPGGVTKGDIVDVAKLILDPRSARSYLYQEWKKKAEQLRDPKYLDQWTKAPLGQYLVPLVRAVDPNEKAGPAGYGEQRLVPVGEELSYTIYFENKPTASAPAQEVFIEDDLDPDLDWTTFQFGAGGFGGKVIPSLENGAVTMSHENYLVVVDRSFDQATGKVRWSLRTIDPKTGELPEDALAGFLPPEDGAGRGQGYLTFQVRTRSDIPTGTVVENKASIVFDTEAPLITNTVFNTVSDALPSATLATIPEAAVLPVESTLGWEAGGFATSYDIYLWKKGEEKPVNPVIAGAMTPAFDPPGDLEYRTDYQWQVVFRNRNGGTPGPVWSFSTAAERFALKVVKGGTGSGTVTSSETVQSISCGTTCYNTYEDGSIVTLLATAEPGTEFSGWSGGCSGSGSCQVTMNRAQEVQALFLDKTPPVLALATLPAGSLTRGGGLPIKGKVTDAGGILKVTVNGVEVPLNVDGSFNHLLPLSPGLNLVKTVALDIEGNETADSRGITYLPDTTAPAVTAFAAPAGSRNRTVLITAFSATDDVGVTGYLVTESDAPPAANAAGWLPTTQGAYTFSGDGLKTLYAWAKDAAGNVSLSRQASVIVDATPPQLAQFAASAKSGSSNVTLSVFSASDNLAVTGYLVTESDVPPAAGDGRWSSTAPVSHTVAPNAKKLYGWAKDAAGNVSAPLAVPIQYWWGLTVEHAGSGGGTITSIPAGISCIDRGGDGCSAAFGAGESVTIVATPSTGSTFGGWGGSCNSTGTCKVEMAADKMVTASFTLASRVRMNGTSFGTLQAAYDAAANGARIEMSEGSCSGPLTADRPIAVLLRGGYNASYSALVGETVVEGRLNVRRGTLRFERVHVK